VLPPGSPQGAVDALRTAVAALDGDKDYVEEAQKTLGFLPEWQTGPDTNTRVREGLSVRADTLSFLADYTKNGHK